MKIVLRKVFNRTHDLLGWKAEYIDNYNKKVILYDGIYKDAALQLIEDIKNAKVVISERDDGWYPDK